MSAGSSPHGILRFCVRSAVSQRTFADQEGLVESASHESI